MLMKFNHKIKPKLQVRKNRWKENKSDIKQSIHILIQYLSV